MIEKLQDWKLLTSLSRVPGEATKGRNPLNYEITHRGHRSKGGVSGCCAPLVTVHSRGRAQDPGAGEAGHTAGASESRTSLRGRKTLSSSSGFLVPSTGKVQHCASWQRKNTGPSRAGNLGSIWSWEVINWWPVHSGLRMVTLLEEEQADELRGT